MIRRAEMAPPREDKQELARSTWQLMFDFLTLTTPIRERSLASRGLTPNDARALFSLDGNEGRPIGTLANRWGCDPSNATFIIDRLEKDGLAERRPSPSDRRVKLVILTPRGAELRSNLLDEFHVPPAELDVLSAAELTQLRNVLRKVAQSAEETPPN